MTPLGETIRFLDQIISQTSFSERPKGVAIDFKRDGGLYLHLCLEEEADDEPDCWSHAFLESEVPELTYPGWVLEYRRLVLESMDPLQTMDDKERARLRSIPDPPPTTEALELLRQDPLYPGEEEPEAGPLMVLFLDTALPEAATREIENDKFRSRAIGAFRCRRVTSRSPLFEQHQVANSQLNFYSLQAELLAARWLASGTFDDLPDLLDRAIGWSQESVAEREKRRVLETQLEEVLEQQYQDGLELCAKALSECKGVFFPARLLVCSETGVIEV
jgi:hypothetical protein